MQIMWYGVALVGGWFWFYLFVRQFLFNFTIAYPTIKKMNAQQELILPSAKKYTAVSVAVCTVFMALVVFLILRFLSLIPVCCFFAGGLVGLIMHIRVLTPTNRAMYDTFCGTYYRFVPDDELRTAMYNKKPSQMKVRLHAMAVSTDCIPNFKN